MLERRLDDQTRGDSKVRQTVSEILRAKSSKPAAIHKALMSLAERGGARTIVTTNFDLLLQASVKRPAIGRDLFSRLDPATNPAE
jgi:hypothetical protein